MTDDPRSLTQSPAPGGEGQAARGGTTPGSSGPPALDQMFDGDSLYALRSAMAAHAAEAGLSPGRVSDAVAAVHELAANAVRHGAGHGRLRVWGHDGALYCLVTDDGVAPAAGGGAGGDGTAPAVGGDGLAATGWRTGFGHGLWLVQRLADEVSLESGPGGTSAAVTFALGPPGPDAPFRLTRQSRDGCTILVAAGQLAPRAADQVIDAAEGVIADGAASRLVLDLAGLTFWDSSGVAALLALQQWVDAHPSARLVLAGPPEAFARRLGEAGPAGRFTVTGTVQEAISLLAAAPPDG
jgi:anti-sigma regulatory factor (Ser/Thr protein kinase)/anti-anti-sigma regulatory factor